MNPPAAPAAVARVAVARVFTDPIGGQPKGEGKPGPTAGPRNHASVGWASEPIAIVADGTRGSSPPWRGAAVAAPAEAAEIDTIAITVRQKSQRTVPPSSVAATWGEGTAGFSINTTMDVE
jgi:hypothetical protein